MSKKHRDKKLIARIKARTAHRKKKNISQGPVSLPFMPSFADIEAPEGFRPIAMSQALMEFATPLTDRLQSDDIDDINNAMQAAVQLWDFTLPKVTHNPPKDVIIENIAKTLQIDERDAATLCDELLERKHYLFPDDIQPDDHRILFMRKEVEYHIDAFDEAQLALSAEPIPADTDDLNMLDLLRRLDEDLDNGEAYDDWEDLYFQVEKACCDGYFKWLTAKGAPEQQGREFPFCIETFLNFVYRYSGVSIPRISEFDVEEFLMDHLPRKVMIQPNDYVYWPPAIRLFYQFLTEKGYCYDPKHLCKLISRAEPEFIDMLKHQFYSG